jgi:hypothetical protein
VHQVRGFDELGGSEEFSTAALARLLVSHKVLSPKNEQEEDGDDEEESPYSKKGVNSIRVSRYGRGHEEE